MERTVVQCSILNSFRLLFKGWKTAQTNYNHLKVQIMFLKINANVKILNFVVLKITHHMKRLTLLIFFIANLILFTQTYAQPFFPSDGVLYDKTVVSRIDILIHPDSLAWIYANVESDHEFRAVFVFDNGNIHDTIRDIGFRLRGNTSRVSQKKSFKVSFNTFISGRKYYGVEKMNLNGEHNDPSVVRSRLYWDILRQSQLAGPRANHVQVFINGNYYGLYANTEHIDEEFVEKYFGNNDGNLYKCLYPADLNYKGSNPDAYKYTAGSRRVYELKINEETDDYSDLAHFIDVLNNTPLAQLPCALEEIFNVQDYLKIAAIDVLTANWDGYIYNKNNFYLYHNTKSGLIEYIPYDADNTFGIDWFGISWASRNIYNWSNTAESRPLFTRLMQVPEYKAQYTYYLKQAIIRITGSPEWFEALFPLRDQLRPYVETDPYYPLDYGYTVESFNNSYVTGTGAHVPVGIKPYQETRNSTALSQVIQSNASPMIKYISLNNPSSWQQIRVQAFTEDENLVSVKLIYTINNGSAQQAEMLDNGLNGDAIAGDGLFTVLLPGMAAGTDFKYQIKATDNNQIASTKPCSAIQYLVPEANALKLYINEFMASNSNTIADEYDEFDDWIEIYNGSNSELWLGDKYLTDNLGSPTKWAFPDTTIAAGGFLIVWADGQPDQGPMHATYKLSKDKEEIGLFNNIASGYALIDSVTYVNQFNDISMGRVTDGAFEWKFFNTPTPGAPNSLLVIEESPVNVFKLWPNPVQNGRIKLSETLTFDVYDLSGRCLMHMESSSEADVSSLSRGMYILKSTQGYSTRFIIL